MTNLERKVVSKTVVSQEFFFSSSYCWTADGYALLSEELAPLAVGQDHDEDGGGERRDQEEAPEEPFVDDLRQESPLPPNLSKKLIK